jgi:ApaG protein
MASGGTREDLSMVSTVTNMGRAHWMIVDGEGERKEVHGEGVVGHFPDLSPGEFFEYTSFCPLEYPWGTMEGTYEFVDENGEHFEAVIGRFFLVSPHV